MLLIVIVRLLLLLDCCYISAPCEEKTVIVFLFISCFMNSCYLFIYHEVALERYFYRRPLVVHIGISPSLHNCIMTVPFYFIYA